MPFLLARVLEEQVHNVDDRILVEWLLPESTRLKGRSRARPDVFAAWKPFSEREVSADELVLPDIIISADSVLIARVELDESDYIPFPYFDRLRNDNAIDCSGLALSRTARGNMYRTHLLMGGV